MGSLFSLLPGERRLDDAPLTEGAGGNDDELMIESNLMGHEDVVVRYFSGSGNPVFLGIS